MRRRLLPLFALLTLVSCKNEPETAVITVTALEATRYMNEALSRFTK